MDASMGRLNVADQIVERGSYGYALFVRVFIGHIFF